MSTLKRYNVWNEMRFFALLFIVVIGISFFFASLGCSTSGITVGTPSDPSKDSEPDVLPPVVVSPTPSPSSSYLPLYWESTTAPHPERKPWSLQVSKFVDENMDVIGAAKDITYFCPKYNSLDKQKKIKAVSELIASVVYFESGYKPTSWMTEKTMGIDPITGKQVVSSGLLQLSYQDMKWAPWCKFDWSKDKLLANGDPKRTINNPEINLACGLPIMNNQIKKSGLFAAQSGVYWAVLRGGETYETRESYCKRTNACGSSDWKTGWCAFQKAAPSVCRYTMIPAIKDRTQKYAVGCK